MRGLGLFVKRVRLVPQVSFLVTRDIVRYYRTHENKKFQRFGLHIYVGKFGQGKTCSMVRDAYNLARQYDDVTILTNLKLCNFPETTTILPLRCIQDIINAPDNTIVLIDEIGTIFNSRDFLEDRGKPKGEKTGLPKVLFQHICQVRHRHMVILGTVQKWGFLEKQLRSITADVTVCSTFPAHPFSRMVSNYVYDADEYDMFYQSPLRPLEPLSMDSWVLTDFIRSLYDTKEMVNTLLSMDYVSDEETDRNTAFDGAPVVEMPLDRRQNRRVSRNLKNK